MRCNSPLTGWSSMDSAFVTHLASEAGMGAFAPCSSCLTGATLVEIASPFSNDGAF
ncbi:Uncharacterised protein [Vibrio cholerae]|nr:Uncharacterised protein [Vibrio cholerae]